MLEGVCVDPGQTAVLESGKRYFLFPDGSNHYYVSNFPNQNAHKGCFQAKYFQIIEKEQWPQEPAAESVNLDPEKIYLAKLIWRKPGYKMVKLQDYFIKPGNTHCYFYHDRNLEKLGGCFPQHWFDDYREIEADKSADNNDFVESELINNCSFTDGEIFNAVVYHFANHSWLRGEIEAGWIQPIERDILNYLSKKIGGEAKNGGTLVDEHGHPIGSFQTDKNSVEVDAYLIKGPKYYFRWKDIVPEIMKKQFLKYEQLSLFDF